MSDKKYQDFKEQTKGLVIVYTGEGKGKTTAALGLALRAAGYKKKVLILQFGKIWFSGELEGVKKLKPFVKLIQGGKGFVKILNDKIPLEEHKKAALDTFNLLSSEIASGKWDVIIADELVGALSAGMIPYEEVFKLIDTKPYELDLVLTGHHASHELLNKADMATEMTPIKHPFDNGFLAKPGIDY